MTSKIKVAFNSESIVYKFVQSQASGASLFIFFLVFRISRFSVNQVNVVQGTETWMK